MQGRWRSAAVGAAALMLTVGPVAVDAHGSIKVGDGAYQMEIGFENEPAYLGQQNGLHVAVGKFGTGGVQPVDDLAGTLQAEVTKDGKTMPLALVPRGDGVYVAPFFPTALGDYTFHVSGTIDGVPVDETMTSSPTTFNSVEPLASVQFPVQTPDTEAVARSLASAEAAASTARTLGIAGLVLGALGTILGAVGLARGRRPAEPATARPVTGEPLIKG